jgi:hypothetical protein
MKPSYESDAASISAVVAALYEVISGPAGVGRDWDRLRFLLFPEARLLRTLLNPDGSVAMAALPVEDFIELAEPYFNATGFYEREVCRRVEAFGHIAQVFSTYEARSGAEGEGGNRLGRGINSIQLWHDGARWWVMSMLWDDERPDSPIPEKYLLTGEG